VQGDLDMPQPPRVDLVAADVERALAELEASRERVYYDADGDAAVRDSFYADVDTDASPQELFDALSALLEATHEPRPSYKPAERVYPWVDLHPDRQLRSIYSGRPFDPEEFIRADAEIARERAARLQEVLVSDWALGSRELAAAFDTIEAELRFNCEHVVPQSWFGKREPMRGDVHHLFTCEPGCNSFRGNSPYADLADLADLADRADTADAAEVADAEAAVMPACGHSEVGGFEPAAGKGPVARATLYFLLRYPAEVGDEARELQRERVPLLLDWHSTEPVGDYERHRNAAIAELQGNRNPLIDHPEWAERIRFEASFPP